MIFLKTNDFKTQQKVIQKVFSNNKNLIELSKHYIKGDSELVSMLSQVSGLEDFISFQVFLNMYLLKKYLSSGFGSAIDQKIQTKLFQSFQLFVETENKSSNKLSKLFGIRSVDSDLWKTIIETVEQIYDNRKPDDCKNSLLFMLSDANDSNVMTKRQIIENTLMFTIMGYKSSVTTVSHLIYSLATNQLIQQKLIKEIDKYVENQRNNRKSTELKCSVKSKRNGETEGNNESVDKEVVVEEVVKEEVIDEEAVEKEREDYLKSIEDLEYLDACVCESLRLYPPVPQLRRTATKDKSIDNIFIPKNCRIVIPIIDVQTDPDNYPEPEKFKPERFLPKNASNIRPGAYLPFGDGLRQCLGRTPALLEIKLCLINILTNFRLVKCSQTKVTVLESNISGNLLNFFLRNSNTEEVVIFSQNFLRMRSPLSWLREIKTCLIDEKFSFFLFILTKLS